MSKQTDLSYLSNKINRNNASANKTFNKTCMTCPSYDNIHPSTMFYKSLNPIHLDGKLPICKECIMKLTYNEDTHNIDADKLKSILRQVDRPFIAKYLQAAINEYAERFDGKQNLPEDNKKKIAAYYFKTINSRALNMTYNDGIEYEKQHDETDISNFYTPVETKSRYREVSFDSEKQTNKTESNMKVFDSVLNDVDDLRNFKVTKEMKVLFGYNFTKRQYFRFWNKYCFLKEGYSGSTPLHINALVEYVKLKCKEEECIEKDMSDAALKWGKNAREAADKAKINPSQLSPDDAQGGVNSFCEMMQMCEQCDDIIPLLPQFQYAPQDSADFIIWEYVNYIRKLEGKPLCSYKDIWKFYDEQKQDYIKNGGEKARKIFEGDPTEKNRESVEKLIDIPEPSDE